MTSTAVTGATQVRLHDLRMRPDGAEWVIGRIDTGEFVSLPELGVMVLRLLGDGRTVDEVRRQLQATIDRDVDVAGFVVSMLEYGFVAALDGRLVAGPPAPRATLPRLRTAHVRWIVSWPVAVGLTIVIAAAATALLRSPEAMPAPRDLLWSTRGGLVIAGNAIVAWSTILLHELAHLLTARAFGVPGRITLGTRLQFLAAQTDVSGIWAAPRWQRVTVYLSGMVTNVAIAAAAILTSAATADGSLPARLSAAVALISLLGLIPQFLMFMRTDLYFLLQDLAGCRNLYGDGSAYVRWWGTRLVRWSTRSTNRPRDPSLLLPVRERRAVRCYAAFLLLGTAACLAVAATVALPFTLTLLTDAAGGLLGGDSVAARVDGLLTVTVIASFWGLWSTAWWRRHGTRARHWYRSITSTYLRERR